MLHGCMRIIHLDIQIDLLHNTKVPRKNVALGEHMIKLNLAVFPVQHKKYNMCIPDGRKSFLIFHLAPVSYTHLTLPTNREV